MQLCPKVVDAGRRSVHQWSRQRCPTARSRSRNTGSQYQQVTTCTITFVVVGGGHLTSGAEATSRWRHTAELRAVEHPTNEHRSENDAAKTAAGRARSTPVLVQSLIITPWSCADQCPALSPPPRHSPTDRARLVTLTSTLCRNVSLSGCFQLRLQQQARRLWRRRYAAHGRWCIVRCR